MLEGACVEHHQPQGFSFTAATRGADRQAGSDTPRIPHGMDESPGAEAG